jgi:hypothetical protein
VLKKVANLPSPSILEKRLIASFSGFSSVKMTPHAWMLGIDKPAPLKIPLVNFS